MNDQADHLFALSDAELIAWWGFFGDYPTGDTRQRRRLDALLSGTIQAEKLTGVFKVPRLAQGPDLMAWQSLPVEKPNRRGSCAPRPVESDRGEWWPDTGAARDALVVSNASSIRGACEGKWRVKGRRLFYSKHLTRPNHARTAA